MSIIGGTRHEAGEKKRASRRRSNTIGVKIDIGWVKSHKPKGNYQVSPLLIEIRVEVIVTFLGKIDVFLRSFSYGVK